MVQQDLALVYLKLEFNNLTPYLLQLYMLTPSPSTWFAGPQGGLPSKHLPGGVRDSRGLRE